MTRILLFVGVALLAVWLWRSSRRTPHDQASENKPAPPSGPQEMVRCAECGVHLPLADAVTGRAGVYCSDEHRQRAEG